MSAQQFIDPRVYNKLNLLLPNQAAKQKLLQAKVKPDPEQLHLLQLMKWGYSKGLLEDDPPLRSLSDLGSLLETMDYHMEPVEVMQALWGNGPDEGAPAAKWIDPRVLAKLNPEQAATYALQQLQALKESKDPTTSTRH
jgi:hypothetical protein